MTTTDGPHRTKALLEACTVSVTPLEPPFPRGYVSLELENGQALAVSKEDGAKIFKLFGGKNLTDRQIEMSADPDDRNRIIIRSVPS